MQIFFGPVYQIQPALKIIKPTWEAGFSGSKTCFPSSFQAFAQLAINLFK